MNTHRYSEEVERAAKDGTCRLSRSSRPGGVGTPQEKSGRERGLSREEDEMGLPGEGRVRALQARLRDERKPDGVLLG